ncbi:unnamed protein product [Peniophora sp. CBMAI 1063]|nr:unnamed protein product [Peniophora sp. CBMAI 1063]
MSTEIWQRWKEVTVYVDSAKYGRLFRSSAPYYVNKDSDQKVDQAAVDVLTQRGIKRIISYNSISYTDAAKALLTKAGITYLHLPVTDFQAPTLAQLKSTVTFRTQSPASSTLIHCGYGQGRTGTGVTAVQLNVTNGANPPESDWEDVNGVEEPAQMAVLREFKKNPTA